MALGSLALLQDCWGKSCRTTRLAGDAPLHPAAGLQAWGAVSAQSTTRVRAQGSAQEPGPGFKPGEQHR